jgi:hypothetical protein
MAIHGQRAIDVAGVLEAFSQLKETPILHEIRLAGALGRFGLQVMRRHSHPKCLEPIDE